MATAAFRRLAADPHVTAECDIYYCRVNSLDRFHLSLPEWLFLGHTTIIERAVSDSEFEMDFRLTHPILGRIYRYAGRFRTTLSVKSD
jgi:hypothetical protein